MKRQKGEWSGMLPELQGLQNTGRVGGSRIRWKHFFFSLEEEKPVSATIELRESLIFGLLFRADGFAVSKAIPGHRFVGSPQFLLQGGRIYPVFVFLLWRSPANNPEWSITSLQYLLVMVEFLGTVVSFCLVD